VDMPSEEVCRFLKNGSKKKASCLPGGAMGM